MSTMVQVPSHYDAVDPNQSLPSEGRHAAVVRQAVTETPALVRVRYQLADGIEKGMLVDQVYNLDNAYGLRQFKQLMLALGLTPADGAIDVEPAVGRQVFVTVVHREHDGVTYANVAAHEARA